MLPPEPPLLISLPQAQLPELVNFIRYAAPSPAFEIVFIAALASTTVAGVPLTEELNHPVT